MASDQDGVGRAAVAARLAPGEALAGRYRLVRQVGAGGMAAVWEAEDVRLARRVAVKVPTDALLGDPRHLERFAREARASARLSHPNVAAVLDCGDDGAGRPFLVLELLEGETLADRLGRGPVPLDEALEIVEGVAAALDAAHAAGVVHRDVKPANVMLTAAGVKVLDFGIAVTAGAAALTTTGIVGTATYLSPEQAAGEPAGPASDVYALGVVVHEVLTGRPPFVADSPVAVAAAHLHAEPPPLRDGAPGVPDHVAAAVAWALAKAPSDRPATASALARALRGPDAGGGGSRATPAAEPTTVLAGPTPTKVLPPVEATAPRPPPGRPARRSGWAWLIGIVAALVLLGMLVAAADGGLELPEDEPTPTTVATSTTVAPATAPVGADPGPDPDDGPGRGDDDRGGSDDDDEDGDEDEGGNGNGNGNGPPSCDRDPSHPSCG